VQYRGCIFASPVLKTLWRVLLGLDLRSQPRRWTRSPASLPFGTETTPCVARYIASIAVHTGLLFIGTMLIRSICRSFTLWIIDCIDSGDWLRYMCLDSGLTTYIPFRTLMGSLRRGLSVQKSAFNGPSRLYSFFILPGRSISWSCN
jgi:hypothetical protein